jgi:hypothetical protein
LEEYLKIIRGKYKCSECNKGKLEIMPTVSEKEIGDPIIVNEEYSFKIYFSMFLMNIK